MTTKLKNRYYLIDSLRGFWIINMVVFHLLYDLFMIFYPNNLFASPVMYIWERFICSSFIFISGLSLNISRNAYKRGILLNILGFIITAVTVLVIPSEAIWFGILNSLGCSMLILQALRDYAEKIHPRTGALVSFLLFAILYGIPYGHIGFFGLKIFNLPDILYSVKHLAFLGFPSADFHSSDYFPIIPWIFLFFTGFFVWKLIKSASIDSFFKIKIPVLDVTGRKSIWIYILHQPVIFGICTLLTIK